MANNAANDHETFLPRVELANKSHSDHFNVANCTVSNERDQEDMAHKMLANLKSGAVTVASLMGPLFGNA